MDMSHTRILFAVFFVMVKIKIYSKQYELDKFIDDNLRCKQYTMSMCTKNLDETNCVKCLAEYYGLEIIYDEIKPNET